MTLFLPHEIIKSISGTVNFLKNKFELFINPNATYNFIFFEGYNLRLSPLEEILFFKSYYLHKKKTIEDFKNILNGYYRYVYYYEKYEYIKFIK